MTLNPLLAIRLTLDEEHLLGDANTVRFVSSDRPFHIVFRGMARA